MKIKQIHRQFKKNGFYRPDFVYQNIYDMINERKARGMSRDELADKADIRIEEIFDYEYGFKYPLKNNYNKLARVLGWQLWKN